MKTFVRIVQTLFALGVCLGVGVAQADAAKGKVYAEQAAHKMKVGDLGKAEMLYAQAMQEEPANLDFPLSLAELYIQQHRYDDAQKILKQSDTRYYRYWKTKGILLQSLQKPEQAISAFKRALQLPGGKSDAYMLTCLQSHYESIGDSARRKQMENLLEMVE